MVLKFEITETERETLVWLRDRHPLPYMRERASALLQIASGKSGRQVAFTGLLRKRRKDTVYDWVHRYEAGGIAGLFIKKGRGRKPSFSP